MITYRCGRCKSLVRTSPKNAGRPVTCHQCGHVSTCPEASTLTPLRPPKARRQPPGSAGFWVTVTAIGIARVAMVFLLQI